MKHGVILSRNLIPAYQIASLMEHLGWEIKVEHDPIMAARIIENKKLDIFIVDAGFPIVSSISLLKSFLLLNPVAYVAAICRNENARCMQQLRNIGIDGYFYLNTKGADLERLHGLTSLLLSLLETEILQPGARTAQMPFHLTGSTLPQIKNMHTEVELNQMQL